MLILLQFVLRLSFGLSLAMALTSPRKVTSGYFRNHSYVLLGLSVVALLAALAHPSKLNRDFNPWFLPDSWCLLTGVVLSYACGATWLYEQRRVGRILLWLVAGASLAAAWGTQVMPLMEKGGNSTPISVIDSYHSHTALQYAPQHILWRLDVITSGLLLGFTIGAMFLGHWYLNTPTMELAPLRKLLAWMAFAVAAEAIVCGIGLVLEWQLPWLEPSQYPLLALHWLAGILGTAVLTWMAWQTLKIPNTQSATGILYVAVITTFIGELSSLLLSGSTGYPV